MSVNELGEFIFENFYKQIGSFKEVIIQWKVWLLFATKLIESIPDACNVREHYQ